MSRRHRSLSALLVTALAAGGLALVPAASASAAMVVTDWASLRTAVNDATGDVDIELGANIDNPAGQNLVVPVGVTVTLDLGERNLTINGLGNYAPAIRVPSGAALVIDGTTGRLVANGGASAAAIGGASGNNQNGEAAGSVTIHGGDVRATAAGAVPSRGAGGAGIGGGGGGNVTSGAGRVGGAGGTITITGGTVRATGSQTATVRDGAGIGGGGGSLSVSGVDGRGGAGADVTVTGGTVIAVGGDDASGIGSGGAYVAGAAGTLTVQGVAAAGSVTTGGRRESASRLTNAATIVATGAPADRAFRAATAGNAYSVRIDYPDAVFLDANGGAPAYAPIALAAGSPIPEPTPPTREGHTFAGWFADAALTDAWDFANDTTASGNTTLFAGWDVNVYPVTFVTNGGTAVPDASAAYGTTLIPPTSSREGHTLVAWHRDAALTQEWDFAADTVPADAVTLYAEWSINSYPVTFASNGGSSVSAQPVEYGTPVPEPAAPTREGHTFAGWFADAALTDAWDFPVDTMPAGALTLYAAWDLNSYDVVFDANGGSFVAGQEVDYDAHVAEPSPPTREGHTFAGWFADAALTDAWDFAGDTMPAGELTLRAAWTVDSYPLVFVSNGGSAVPPQDVDYGTHMAPSDVPTRVGHTFAGWFADAALETEWDIAVDTMPAHGVTLYAAWSVNSYDVTFVTNGGSAVATTAVAYDTLVPEPTAPTREGHTFAGWFADAELETAWSFVIDTMPAGGLTLFAAWTVNSYPVTFASNGGSPVAGTSVDYGTHVIRPADPTRVGHSFAGWFADAALATAWEFAVDTMPAGGLTLHAAWSVNSYRVSFDSGGGSAVPELSVVYDALVPEPPAPALVGHTFAGWFADAALTDAWEFAVDTMPAEDIVLWAGWDVNSYSVTFAANGGAFVAGQSVDFGTPVTEPPAPMREGHRFAGWFADAALTDAWDFDLDTMPAGELTLHAAWHVNSYGVSFDSGGGSAVPELMFAYGTLVTEPAAPSRVGHTFAGWFADAGLTDAWDFATDTMPAHGVTLYAAWDVNDYFVIYVTNGGGHVAGHPVPFGAHLVEPALAREGHTFAGWFSDGAYTTAWDFDVDTMPAGSLVLFAAWTVNSYPVIFASEGGSPVAGASVDYGTHVIRPADPTRVGHSFAGWFADAALTTAWDFDLDTMPSGELTLHAAWDVNSYGVSFDENGGSIVPDLTVAYDTLVTEPADPSRVGHTFAGWFADAALTVPWRFGVDTMPAADLMLRAAWTVNSYPVAFDANGGGAVPGQDVDYGTLVTEPAAPSRAGHTFAGWFADAALTEPWDFAADTMPADALTLHAAWSINSYLVSFDAAGGTPIAPQTIEYGSPIVPVTPTRTGYVFAGWSDGGLAWAPHMLVLHDVTLTASWTPFGAAVTPGSGQLLVSWDAAVLPESPATDYLVSVEPGGASCTSSATACAVTGLEPGSYSVVVTARWADAEAVSTPVAVELGELPLPTEVPDASAGEVTLALSRGGAAVGSAAQGTALTAVGTGFVPGSTVEFAIYSEPRMLGEATAGPDGTVSARLVIPADLELGEHTVIARGFTADGHETGYGVAALRVVAPALAGTGVDLATGVHVPLLAAMALLLLGVAGFRLGRARMRPKTTRTGG